MGRFLRSVGCALSGIAASLRTQRNLRIHVVATVCVVATGLFLSLNALEWSMLCLAIALVISAELINTAIEHTIDLVSTERRPLAKAAKDAAAGAVLVAALMSVAIGLLVLGPPLWRLLE